MWSARGRRVYVWLPSARPIVLVPFMLILSGFWGASSARGARLPETYKMKSALPFLLRDRDGLNPEGASYVRTAPASLISMR
jgi:hypothetical protein